MEKKLKEDWRKFMPQSKITIKELAKIVKLIDLKINFNEITVPKNLHKHFAKMEKIK